MTLAKARLAAKAQQEEIIARYPGSGDAELFRRLQADEARRDEVQLQKLAKRNDAVDFNFSEIQRLGDNEQMVIKGDKVTISRIDTGEILYETSRRGHKLALKLPSRTEALAQMEDIGMLKQVKGVPVAVIKKEELFSTIRKAVKEYMEQQELAKKEYEANVLAGKASAEQEFSERRNSISASLHADMDSIIESVPEEWSIWSTKKPSASGEDAFLKASAKDDETDWSNYDSHNLGQQNLLNHFASQMNMPSFRM